jgi:hypothetical protein
MFCRARFPVLDTPDLVLQPGIHLHQINDGPDEQSFIFDSGSIVAGPTGITTNVSMYDAIGPSAEWSVENSIDGGATWSILNGPISIAAPMGFTDGAYETIRETTVGEQLRLRIAGDLGFAHVNLAMYAFTARVT